MRKVEISLITMLLVVLIIFVGCQSTPINLVINQKKDLLLAINKNITTEPFLKSQLPSVWKEQYSTENNFVVNIDANIVIPQVSQLPIYKVESNDFSIEQLNRMIKYFIGNNTLYLSKDPNDISSYSKQRLKT